MPDTEPILWYAMRATYGRNQEAKKRLDEKDKKRCVSYNHYTGKKWGDPANYDLCINTSNISFETAVDIIMDYINKVNNA